MRDKYPKINLIDSGDVLFDELFNSLKYSTHGEFKIVSNTQKYDISSSHHFTYSLSESSNYPCEDAEFTIGFFSNQFIFFQGSKINGSEPLEKEDVIKLNSGVEKFIFNIPEKLEAERLILDFLINQEGKPAFLGAQTISNKVLTVFDSNSEISDSFNSNFTFELNAKNKVGWFEVLFNKGSNPRHSLILNYFGEHWVGYRSFGINIPLLIIQSLLLRDFKTVKLLKDCDVDIDHNYVNFPKYVMMFDNVYFDLDETLICKNRPVSSMVSLLKWFFERGKKIYLITRHVGNISEALRLINLDERWFSEMIYVKPTKLKSEFIKGSSIFIDNEFPQRLDVSLNCHIPSLDLDQTDFIAEVSRHEQSSK